MLTPEYYLSGEGSEFKNEINNFLDNVRKCRFHHPLEDESGMIPDYYIPVIGDFGAQKGTALIAQHHPAIDLHVVGNETDVTIYAAHDGIAATFKDADKYRHYISITKNIFDESQQLIGKLVTIYGHVDLDLDEADSILMDGQIVSSGDIISQHLYSETVGGPHLHFEIRYYRPADNANETFYGSRFPGVPSDLTEPSVEPWEYGYWDPDTGYGFGHPDNHLLDLDPYCGDEDHPYNTGDISKDCHVNFEDLELMVQYWLYENCYQADCEDADLTLDGNVGFEDFSELARYWLQSTAPN